VGTLDVRTKVVFNGKGLVRIALDRKFNGDAFCAFICVLTPLGDGTRERESFTYFYTFSTSTLFFGPLARLTHTCGRLARMKACANITFTPSHVLDIGFTPGLEVVST
jgi:hypothetical protein